MRDVDLYTETQTLGERLAARDRRNTRRTGVFLAFCGLLYLFERLNLLPGLTPVLAGFTAVTKWLVVFLPLMLIAIYRGAPRLWVTPETLDYVGRYSDTNVPWTQLVEFKSRRVGFLTGPRWWIYAVVATTNRPAGQRLVLLFTTRTADDADCMVHFLDRCRLAASHSRQEPRLPLPVNTG